MIAKNEGIDKLRRHEVPVITENEVYFDIMYMKIHWVCNVGRKKLYKVTELTIKCWVSNIYSP